MFPIRKLEVSHLETVFLNNDVDFEVLLNSYMDAIIDNLLETLEEVAL